MDLGELRAADLPSVGGKAANLGELISAGLPVPGGFCVTTAAYARAAADVDTADPVRARELLRSAPLPDDVATAVVAAYRRLCAQDGADPAGDGEPDVPVAVRSSATAEDLPFASFAGQQDTYLNVVGRRGGARRRAPLLGLAVDRPRRRLPRRPRDRRRRRCGSPWWSSGWSTRRSPGCCSPPTR